MSVDLRDGPSSSAGPSSGSEALLRAALDPKQVSNAQVTQYYRERLHDRRIQIGNLDRTRPKAGGDDALAALKAQRKLTRRKRRVKSDLSELKRTRIAACRRIHDPQTIQRSHVEDGLEPTSALKGKQRQLSRVKKELKKLQNRPRGSNTAKKIDPASSKQLSRSQRKRLGLEDVDANVSYDLIKPLHDLWCSYIQQLLNIVSMDSKGNLAPNPHFDVKNLNTMSSGTVSAVQASLIKSDLSGAEVEVVRSSNPSLVSQRGLVVKETERTMILAIQPSVHGELPARKASKGREVRIIPKHNTVFAIYVPLPTASEQGASKLCFELHGSHMMHTLPSRATRKYKSRPTIDF